MGGTHQSRPFYFTLRMKTLLALPLALLVAVSAFAENPLAAAPTTPAVKAKGSDYSIDQCVNSFEPAKAKPTRAGFEYWFATRDFADLTTVKLSIVGPNLATHAPHRHIEDEFFFVIEGQAEFYLDGERRVVGPMTSLYAPSMREHGIKNAGTTELKYLVLKKYPEKK